MTHTYESDVKILIQYAKNQECGIPDVVGASRRLEAAIEKDLSDYSIPEEGIMHKLTSNRIEF